MHERSNMQTTGYSTTLLTGMVIGGAMALLLSPKRGAEVRSDLRGHYERMRTKATTASQKAEDVAKKAAKQVSSVAENRKKNEEDDAGIRFK